MSPQAESWEDSHGQVLSKWRSDQRVPDRRIRKRGHRKIADGPRSNFARVSADAGEAIGTPALAARSMVDEREGHSYPLFDLIPF